ncbi:helix-turn-helix domain-containing protein [Bacillus ndiopicus]|uniref:helix-turn-helix domain-containing protein n=1 Tax=Bacillus ndiopicus TaxID=1347368 RepID=UPI0005A941F4|nr:helix-turn-helix transcriptional regulator [Bacillus ndiopicus]
MNFGATLQKVRKNRQLTQKELAHGIVQQGTYSRIERGQLPINAELLVQLVERLNMTVNEFVYIHLHYQISEHEKITRAFADMDLTTPTEIKKHLAHAQRYIQQNSDDYIQMLVQAYQSLLVLTEEGDLQQARILAEQIWAKMQRLDHWYINDLELLNAIIFLFPLDTAVEIVKTATKRLDMYENFYKDLTYLKIYFHLNLSILYLESKEYNTCIAMLDSIYQQFKKKLTYQTLGFIYTYKAICLFHLGRQNEKEIHNLTTLMHLFDDEDNLTALLHVISSQCQLKSN